MKVDSVREKESQEEVSEVDLGWACFWVMEWSSGVPDLVIQ